VITALNKATMAVDIAWIKVADISNRYAYPLPGLRHTRPYLCRHYRRALLIEPVIVVVRRLTILSITMITFLSAESVPKLRAMPRRNRSSTIGHERRLQNMYVPQLML
jgi:hypothetical protein